MLKLKILASLFFYCTLSYGQAPHPMIPLSLEELEKRRELIRQDNEYVRNEIGRHTNIHVNCLILNATPLDIAYFSTRSWGMLSVVRGKPGSGNDVKLLFRAYLRRNGAVVFNPLFNNPAYEVSLSKLLAFAKVGDQLVIDPVNQEDYKAKRILKLID